MTTRNPAARHHVRRWAAVTVALVLGIGAAGQSVATAADGHVDPVATALVERGGLDSLSDVRALADASEGVGGTPVGVVIDRNGDAPGGISVERIHAAPGDVTALTRRLQGVDGVFAAAPDSPVSVSSDPLEPLQYGPTRIGARSLAGTLDGRGTTVAVVDTGVTATHPDLLAPLPDGRPRVAAGRTFLLGDPATGSPGTTDPHGHGTHVAGIIAAARGDGVGGSGVAPGAQILPVRVLNQLGTGWSSDVAAGVLWAHQQGADVINLSIGATGTTPPDLAAALEFVTTDRSRGKPPTVVVAAAGNAGPTSLPQWPGDHPSVIAVGATDAADHIAPYSSWGNYVDVSAPGDDILSTCRTLDWCTMSGTSMATPMVSGAAAILRQVDPSRGPADVMARLQSTAVDLGAPGWDAAFGAGRVDLVAATAPGAPASRPASSLPSGTVDYTFNDRRTVYMGGTAFDPDGPPLVRVLAVTGGRAVVHDVPSTGGRWSTTWDDGTGSMAACAVALHDGGGAGVLLGCRNLLVK